MADDRIYAGSRARILLPAVDVTPDGEESFTPTDLTLTVYGPTGVKEVGTLGEEDGVPHIDFAEDELDGRGIWRIEAEDEGYLAQPVTFRVY